jgi:putative nucleotidyltransferase with HDIG domain
MLEESLQARIGEILTTTRDALGVARARCYAMDPTGDFRLAARYGFPPRFAPEGLLNVTDPLVDWIRRHRRSMYANSPAEAGPLGRAMERDGYARTLAAPIYDGSRLAGLLELQEKLGGALFNLDDLRRLEPIVDQIAAVLHEYGTNVAAPEEMAPEDAEALFFAPAPTVMDELPPPPALFEAAPEPPESVAESARSYESERSDLSRPAVPPALSRREVLVLKGFLSTLLLEAEVAAAVFSFWTEGSAEISIGARQPLSAAAREALVQALESAFASARPGVAAPSARKIEQEFPLGRQAGELEGFVGAQTSVVFSGPGTLLLTVAFSRPPEPSNQPALAQVHRLVQSVIRGSRDVEAYRVSYRSLVNFLLEPGRRPYPQLKAHSLSVAALSRRFAAALGLGAEVVEQLTVAGLLHDIGLKELRLPYERISGRRPLDLEELGIVRQHPVLGATLLDRIQFPYPIAPLVRHHHERFDGAGYPDHLAGEKIPLGSRILALAESYDAMTAPHSYRSPVSLDAAVEIISLKSGTQFDPDLARRFVELVRSGAGAPSGPAMRELQR